MKSLPSTAELLEIPLWLLRTLKKGEISLYADSIGNIELTIEENRINLNFHQENQLKAILQLEAETKEDPLPKRLETLRLLAETLKQERLTITISLRDKRMLTIGYGANPTFSQRVTATDAIEVNNLVELVKLAG